MSSPIRQIDRDNIPPHIRNIYTKASLIALGGNILLLASKAIAAWLSGSSAIRADAANSASDVAYSALMGLGLWLSLRPPDSSHPHGHRRYEALVSLVIGGMMTYAGIEAARSGIVAWQNHTRPLVGLWPILILINTGLVKTVMFLASRRLGQRAKSPALLATARDNLSDIVSSGMALVGLLLSQVALVADPIAAFLVAAWIFRGAWAVLSESVRQLVGGAGSRDLYEAVLSAACAVPGVSGVERVIIEYAGPQAYVDIHIHMPADSTLDQTHHVSHAVRRAVQALDEVDHAFVHVEPDASFAAPDINQRIRAIAGRLANASVHSIQMHDVSGKLYATLHLEVERTLSIERAHELADQLEDMLRTEISEIADVEVHIEPATHPDGPADTADGATTDEAREALGQAVEEVGGLSNCHDLMVYREDGELMVNVHCECEASLSVDEAHTLSMKLEHRLQERMPSLTRVVVHVEPRKG